MYTFSMKKDQLRANPTLEEIKLSRQLAGASFGSQGEEQFDQRILEAIRGGKKKKKNKQAQEPLSVHDLI